MPDFMISVASPVFPEMAFRYKNEVYTQRTTVQFDFPSIHLYGKLDKYKEQLTIHSLFSNPQVIWFNASHRFPRELTTEDFTILK